MMTMSGAAKMAWTQLRWMRGEWKKGCKDLSGGNKRWRERKRLSWRSLGVKKSERCAGLHVS